MCSFSWCSMPAWQVGKAGYAFVFHVSLWGQVPNASWWKALLVICSVTFQHKYNPCSSLHSDQSWAWKQSQRRHSETKQTIRSSTSWTQCKVVPFQALWGKAALNASVLLLIKWLVVCVCLCVWGFFVLFFLHRRKVESRRYSRCLLPDAQPFYMQRRIIQILNHSAFII